MNPGDVSLALALLNMLLSFIASVRAQGGLTDDVLAAQVQTVTQGNSQAYAALMGALSLPTSSPATSPSSPASPSSPSDSPSASPTA
jgi:hypothetical protein